MLTKRSIWTPATPTDKENGDFKYGYGVRHIQLAIFLLCLTVNIIGRSHMGVTIVAMTTSPEPITATYYLNQSNPNVSATEQANSVIDSNNQNHTTWKWSKPIQEMVLNAFYLGYLILMLPMGMVSQRYGGKFTLQIGLFINGVASILTPWLTLWGDWKGVCFCRLLQGLSQAGTYPSIQNLLAKWVPENERATLGACVHTGLTLGTVVGYQLAGFLGASKWGWPSIFYAVGAICLVCFTVLTIFGAASPLDHKSINDDEKNYVMGPTNDGNRKKLKTPWRGIFTSKPLWGTIATHVCSNATFVFFFIQVPTYIHYTLNIDVKNSGLLSSLPYVAGFVTNLLFGWLADYCTNHNIVSKNNTRRISDIIANYGMVVCLILTSYTSNTIVVVTCLVIAMASNSGSITGWMVNYIDLAPNFAGTLMSAGNTISNVLVILTPLIVSHVVTDMKLKTPWRGIFTSKPLWGTIATHVCSNATFVFFFIQVPTYIHYTLNIDVKNSGLLSSLPYVAGFVTNLLFGWLADYCTNHNIVSKNNTRRISDIIANYGMVVCLILTSYTSNTIVVVTCLVIAMASNSGSITGWMVNYIDLAPNFAGTLMSAGNTISNVLVILTPLIVSHVVTDMTNIIQWRIMFFIAAGVCIVSNLIFLLVMSTDVQPWNYGEPKEPDVEAKTRETKSNKKSLDVL